MNILVTGAKGFVGKNLIIALKQIQNGNDKTHERLIGKINDIFEFGSKDDDKTLREYCEKADFIFNFAGVNRPKDEKDFQTINVGFNEKLINILEEIKNDCPIMFSSSTQANLEGRFKDSIYGKSKLNAEDLFFAHSKKVGSKVFVYRFPNLFGKFCKPNYNSAVATFSHNIANDLPITINDKNTEIELFYIDDLIEEMLYILSYYNDNSCYKDSNVKPIFVSKTYKKTLGEISDLLYEFNNVSNTLIIPKLTYDSFEAKLYATYLSYLPDRKTKFSLKMNVDDRGSFTELLKTLDYGQISVNITKPGITKGMHFHHTKWEYFIVVSGEAIIRERKVGFDENGNTYPVKEFKVSSEKIEAVYMLPGFTHSIENISKDKDLVTVMWASELFDKNHPDTFREEV